MSNATNRWLDRLAEAEKAKGGTGSDYRLAQLLGIERQMVSKYRRELDQMGDGAAIRLAELLELHPMIVVGEIRAERGRDERERRFWSSAAKNARKGGTAAAVILAASLSGAPGFSSPQTASSTPGGAVSDCILCKVPPRPVPRAPRGPMPPPALVPGRIRQLGLAA